MSTQVSLASRVSEALAEVTARVSASVVQVCTPGGGSGAGVIWRPDGTILTNNHVARHGHGEVTLADGRVLAANVTARDPHNDLAVLKVAVGDLPAATIGDARRLRVGELVLAVGHPFGMRSAATLGVVSAVHEGGAGQARELVRADVVIGPGSSGGPLVDARGRVVGINAMISGGLALAVPSHLAAQLVDGRLARPTLGIEAQDVALPPAMAAGAPVHSGCGALIVSVAAGSPAEAFGLLIGDILVALDNRPLQGTAGLLNALAAHPGGPIRLGLLRGGVPLDIVVEPDQAALRAA